MILNFPYKYYFFGSDDSTDIDVLLETDKILQNKEESIQLLKQLNIQFNLNWNANFIVIENGIIKETINSKSSVDGVNNSLYSTYHLHKQDFPNPITKLVPRHKLLNLYKCVRTCLTNCTRIDELHRTKLMPLKGLHPFQHKVDSLKWIDYRLINTFNQRYQKDIDTWKILAFYIGQTLSLFKDNIEIYTKKDLIKYYPEFYNFIYRLPLTNTNKEYLQNKKNELIQLINSLTFENLKQDTGFFNILRLNNEVIDMYKEEIVK